MFIRAEIAIMIQTNESGFGRYSEPHKEPPAKASHHKTAAHRINEPAIMFCTVYSAFSERENVAMKVNSTADRPHSASARCSINTTSTPAMTRANG